MALVRRFWHVDCGWCRQNLLDGSPELEFRVGYGDSSEWYYLPVSRVTHVVFKEKYLSLYTENEGEVYLSDSAIRHWIHCYESDGFVQIHRNSAVRADEVVSTHAEKHDRRTYYKLRMPNNDLLPVSRRAASKLFQSKLRRDKELYRILRARQAPAPSNDMSEIE